MKTAKGGDSGRDRCPQGKGIKQVKSNSTEQGEKNMRKTLLILSVMAIAVLNSSSVLAAAWLVPNNVRIVQKSNPDTQGRVYGSIQSAINSITNASASNPYVVKVMPGIYSEAVALKPYVALEGSGSDTTIINASVRDGSTDCMAGALIVANNSSVKSIAVINNSTTGGLYDSVTGIVMLNATATAEAIKVTVSGNGLYNVGICMGGTTGSFILSNSYLEATTSNNGNGRSNAAKNQSDGTLTINNSKLVASGNNNIENDVMNCGGPGGLGKAVLSDSVLESNGNNMSTYLVDGFACDVYVNNSKMIANGNPASLCALNVGNHYEDDTPYDMKVATSLIQGGSGFLCGGGGTVTGADAKLVNNHDENYNPVPNQ